MARLWEEVGVAGESNAMAGELKGEKQECLGKAGALVDPCHNRPHSTAHKDTHTHEQSLTSTNMLLSNKYVVLSLQPLES